MRKALGLWGSLFATVGFSSSLLYSGVIAFNLVSTFPTWFDKLRYIIFFVILGTGSGASAGIICGFVGWYIFPSGFRKSSSKTLSGYSKPIFILNFLSSSLVASFWLTKYYHREFGPDFWLSLSIALAAITVILTATIRMIRNFRPAKLGMLAVLVALTITLALGVQVFFVKPNLKETYDPGKDSAYYAKTFRSTENYFRVGPKNVILILLDALRADHLSLYGYSRATSPFVDSLGNRNVVFENAYCQWNSTRLSMPSMFTSIYPRISGVVDPVAFEKEKPVPFSLSRNLKYPYLTEILSRSGYHTSMLLQNNWLLKNKLTGSVCDYFAEVPFDTTGDRNSELMLRAFDSWADTVDVTTPFFLFMHFLDPHDPYTSSAETVKELVPGFVPGGIKLPLAGKLNDRVIFFLSNDAEAREQMTARYDGEILNSDKHLRLLFDKLHNLNLLDSTLVVITADHGELLGEKNDVWSHGSIPYEGSLRVPLIMVYPELPQGLRLEQRVELVDLMPTILSSLGVPFDGVVNGKDLLPIILGDPGNNYSDRVLSAGLFNTCLIRGGYKLTFNEMAFTRHHYYQLSRLVNPRSHLDLIMDIWGETERLACLERWTLYDIKNDPWEKVNLVESRQDVFDSMLEELSIYYSQLYKIDRSLFLNMKMSPEEIERLKALGYVK